jgi:hypothetical protein
VHDEKSDLRQSMQLTIEPALAPYVPPDLDTAFGDEALARRAKAMACTVPLHQLEANKGRMRDGEFNAYTVWGLAFVAIDTVTVQMDFDRGAAHEAVIEAMLPYARRQAPDRGEAEHREVCKWVLDELIGTSSQREFTVEYGDWNGEYVRHSFGFQLLAERQAPDGSVYLRATDAAINVLVGALDTDVESAQAAAEAKLENLVRPSGRSSSGQRRTRSTTPRRRAGRLRAFRDALTRFVRTYSFVSQIAAFTDPALERDYVYCRALSLYLRDTGTVERLDLGTEVELTHLRHQMTFNGTLALASDVGEVRSFFGEGPGEPAGARLGAPVEHRRGSQRALRDELDRRRQAAAGSVRGELGRR